MDLLSSHPQVRAYNEPFNAPEHRERARRQGQEHLYAHMDPPRCFDVFYAGRRLPRPLALWRYVDEICDVDDACRGVGFKLMYLQLKKHPTLMAKLLADRFRVVHLVRENYLDILISWAVYRQSGRFHAGQRLSATRVRLDPDVLLYELWRCKRRRKRGDRVVGLCGLPSVTVRYEDLATDPQGVVDSIVAFLGLAPHGVTSAQRKLNALPHWESIENYDEVRRTLRGTEFEGLLKQPEGTQGARSRHAT